MTYQVLNLTQLKNSPHEEDRAKWIERIKSAHFDCRTNPETAETLGISISTLVRWIRQLRMEGIEIARRPRSDERWDQVISGEIPIGDVVPEVTAVGEA